MKIYFVSPIIYGKKNAEFTHTIELYRNLKKIGNRIFLFIFKNAEYIENEDDIVYVPTVNKKILWAILGQITLFFSLFNHKIKYGVPDVIYTRITRITFIPLFVSKLFNIPYVIEVNGLIIDELQARNKAKWQIWLAEKMFNINYRNSDKIVAVTEGIKEALIRTCHIADEKIIIINNGVNIDLFRPYDKQKSKKDLGLKKELNFICFIGSLRPWQGMDDLIKSSKKILKKFPKTRFLIVGDGETKNDLIKIAKENRVFEKFIFTGSVPYKLVPKYISSADICIVPKKPLRSGYSPLKLYEYMACEKPIVATRVKGFEILEEINAGLLIKPGDIEDFSKAVSHLLENTKVRKKMGINGRAYVIKNHTWNKIAKRTEEIFNEEIEIKAGNK